jgi:hypothetical protein
MKPALGALIVVAALTISACGSSHRSRPAQMADTSHAPHSSQSQSASGRAHHDRPTPSSVAATTSTAQAPARTATKTTAITLPPPHHATGTATATTPTSITTKSGTVITVAGSPDATPTTPGSQVLQSPPTPTGADPSGADTPIPCLQAAGLKDAHLWETGSWEATDASSVAYFIDGPFASHSAAQTDANTLTPIAYVAVGGAYVVQTPLTNKATGPLLSVAACLAS